MRILLDTPVFLWFISGDPRLPTTFRQAIQDPANTISDLQTHRGDPLPRAASAFHARLRRTAKQSSF